MAREILDRKIRHLLDEVLSLNSMVEQATMEAVEALRTRNLTEAQRIYEGDKFINARRFELENDCMITIATQQPIMARDLRLLASLLEVTGELERMGDYAKGIAHICLMMGSERPLKLPSAIPQMAEIAVSMLHRAVGAFVTEDSGLASQIPAEDDQVDALYQQVYHELVSLMFSDNSTIDRANYLMWVAHNLERMADRVTNICERTLYVATGEMREIDHSDDESRDKTNGL
ncbi:MAG: phosphate signaling complex protein PhoU [Anaerolineales bacterium]|nr:phosphate signaling complex protein PhoU [Anaerolineales bacterium]